MDPQIRDDLANVYIEAEGELVDGYIRADRLVYAFSKRHGLSTAEAWRLMGTEASSRGHKAVRYLSEHPLTVRSDDERLVELMSRKAADGVEDLVRWAFDALRNRGSGRERQP